MSTDVLAALLVAAIGLPLAVLIVIGLAWAMSPRRPGTTHQRQRATAGSLLDRTEPWA